jgi:hypothetical protein
MGFGKSLNHGRTDRLARFRIAAAARRMAGRSLRGGGRPEWIDPAEIAEACHVDPEAWLNRRGYKVSRQKDRLSVKDGLREVYRMDRTERGWLWCEHGPRANGRFRGGRLPDLVREIDGCSLPEAVRTLLEAPPSVAKTSSCTADGPRMPRQGPEDREAGRRYLSGRGISAEVMDAAEASGFLGYSQAAVLYLGRDHTGRIRSITRRDIRPEAKTPKRDLAGSDKSRYPAILPGELETVWVVEGGMDALALHELARKGNRPAPTAIVTGGAGTRRWMDTAHVRAILEQAKKITVSCEREETPSTQFRTDVLHARQAERMARVTGWPATLWYPPKGIKDLGDLVENQGEPKLTEAVADEGKQWR